MASPKRRRRKRAARSVLGIAPPFDSGEITAMADTALLKEAMRYAIFTAGSSTTHGASQQFADGAKAQGESLINDVVAQSGLFSSLRDLDTKFLAHITVVAPATMNGAWIKIGDKYFAFDDTVAGDDGATVIDLDHDDNGGTDTVKAIRVGTLAAGNHKKTVLDALKAAIESANGFGGKISVVKNGNANTDDKLLLSWSPRDLGALSITQKAAEATILRSTARGGALASEIPMYYLNATPRTLTDDRGILFYVNGPGCKYIQSSSDIAATMLASIEPAGFGANKAIHMKIVADMAASDGIKVEQIEDGAAEAFDNTTSIGGTSLEFASGPITAKLGLNTSGDHTIAEYVFVHGAGGGNDGIKLTASRGATDRVVGKGFVIRWELVDWAA